MISARSCFSVASAPLWPIRANARHSTWLTVGAHGLLESVGRFYQTLHSARRIDLAPSVTVIYGEDGSCKCCIVDVLTRAALPTQICQHIGCPSRVEVTRDFYHPMNHSSSFSTWSIAGPQSFDADIDFAPNLRRGAVPLVLSRLGRAYRNASPLRSSWSNSRMKACLIRDEIQRSHVI
jgi:hypothetical protein